MPAVQQLAGAPYQVRWQRLDREEIGLQPFRFGQTRAHPATLIERDSRAAFVAAVKALQLPLGAAEPPRMGRPPGIPLTRKGR